MASHGGANTVSLGAPGTAPTAVVPQQYDPEPERDKARKNIAYALLAITATVVIGGFVLTTFSINPSGNLFVNIRAMQAYMNIVFGPLIALLGSATGFYFGVNAGQRNSGK